MQAFHFLTSFQLLFSSRETIVEVSPLFTTFIEVYSTDRQVYDL